MSPRYTFYTPVIIAINLRPCLQKKTKKQLKSLTLYFNHDKNFKISVFVAL